MKKYILLLVSITGFFYAAGQTNFVKGFIITSNGDSVTGSIDYRNWKNNPLSVTFLSEKNEKKTFDANTIKGFYIFSANEMYTSFTVEMDMQPGDADNAINNLVIDSPSITRAFFLLQLVKHPLVSLFYFSDSRREHFYYVKANEPPVELIHRYIYNESSKQVQENAKYKTQLFELFSSCSDVANAAQQIKFRKKEMEDGFTEFIQCSAPGSSVYTKKKDPVVVKLGVIAGFMKNTFHFEGTNTLLVDENYSGNNSPVFGVSADIGLSRNQYKWHIVNELIYKMYKTSSSFTGPFGNGYTVTNDVAIALSYAQLNTMLRYVFVTKGSLMPYLNAGIGNGFIVKESKNSLHSRYSFGTEEDTRAVDGPKKYEFSLQAGAGISIRKIQIEIRYATNKKGFSPALSYNVNPKSIQVTGTYQF